MWMMWEWGQHVGWGGDGVVALSLCCIYTEWHYILSNTGTVIYDVLCLFSVELMFNQKLCTRVAMSMCGSEFCKLEGRVLYVNWWRNHLDSDDFQGLWVHVDYFSNVLWNFITEFHAAFASLPHIDIATVFYCVLLYCIATLLCKNKFYIYIYIYIYIYTVIQKNRPP